MKVSLKSIADKGVLDSERLVLNVVQDTDLGEYVILRTSYVDSKLKVEPSHAFWFPDKPAKAGDLVVIYSKTGTYSEKALDNGRTAHFYYWKSSVALWNDVTWAAVVLYAPTWDAKTVAEL